VASIDDYLETDYSPDREFVDGAVVERHVGERPHSRVLGNVVFSLRNCDPRLFVWPEQRVRTIPNRCRVPDVCVTTQDPFTDVFETPPLICIEILSRRDEMSDVLEKLEEYAAAGVRYIWVVVRVARRRSSMMAVCGRLLPTFLSQQTSLLSNFLWPTCFSSYSATAPRVWRL
jgi:Uma2 family endonuclease